ncbi:MAG: 2,3-diphosphoglycerate-dependent phosphoglycerate mutase [Arsenophonus sp.]|nr:MAG: 2,3-diphosphoglycerate-dependent phosphoglycerate mutase [Arsenophonus sp.]
MIIAKLVLLRHGKSQWNEQNRFTGWTDIGLSEKGYVEAKKVGKFFKKNKFHFDLAYTSTLNRASDTLIKILNEINHNHIPIEKSWFLNERHYGALEGLKKTELIKQYGKKQVNLWRKDFHTIPPKINENDPKYPGNNQKYAHLKKSILPLGESLYETMKRVIIYWEKTIKPQLKQGKNIIIVAHGNSLRTLIKYIDNMNETDFFHFYIPNAKPIIYYFFKNMKPIKISYCFQH